MQPWQASLLACFVGMLTGALSAYVAIKNLQVRHDERIKHLERELKRASKNIHDLREDVRSSLVRYLEDRVQDSKEKHVAGTLRKHFRRPAQEFDEDDHDDDRDS